MSLDITIVLGFLLLNLIVGLHYGRNVNNITDYALGNRNFSTATLTATVIATWIGGSSFGMNLYGTYNQGMYFVIPGLADAVSFLIVGYFMAPRLSQFLGKLSIAEAMGDLYNDSVRGISAISAIIPAIGNVAMQFSILAILLKYLLGDLSPYIVILSCSIVVIYAVLGGIRSVTLTDLIQFATFGIFVPLLTVVIWQSLDNTNALAELFKTNELFDYSKLSNISDPQVFDAFLVFLFFLIPGFDPALFQRISMAKNADQVSKVCFITAGIVCLVYLFLDFIGALVLSSNVVLESEDVIRPILDNYLGVGFKGIFFIGIMAMAMSTADSYINSSAILFAHDLLQANGIKCSERMELFIVRITAIVIGVSALFLSMYPTSLLDLILATYSFYMPIVSVPFLLAIFGFRSSSRAVLIGMLFGFIAVISIKIFFDIDSLIPGMLSNLIAFLGFHYLLKEPGGWSNNHNPEKKISIADRYYNLLNKVKVFNLVKYCNNYKPREIAIYFYFAFLVALTIFVTLSIDSVIYNQYLYLINFLQAIVLLMITAFTTHQLYNKSFKEKYIGVIWYLSVFVGLIFISSFLVLMSKFSHISLIVLTIHLTMVPLLIGWRMALMMIPIGLLLSFSLYESIIGGFVQSESYDFKIKLIYLLFIVGGFSATILRNKEEVQLKTEEKTEHLENIIIDLQKENEYAKREIQNLVQGMDVLENQFAQKSGALKAKEVYLKDKIKLMRTELANAQEMKEEFIRNIPHETNTPMTAILSLSDVLYSHYDSLEKGKIKESLKCIIKGGERLKSYINNITDLSKLSSLSYNLKKTRVNLSKLIEKRALLYKKIFSDDAHKQDFKFDIDKDIRIQCDEYYIAQVIDNLISNATKYGKDKPIKISLHKKGDNNIEFTIEDKGIGIVQNELVRIFDKFMVSAKTKSQAEGRGIGLALCKKIIDVHQGSIWAESDGRSGSKFSFILPLA